MFDWNDLRFLLAAADAGSTVAAARQLKLNQTTVARRIVALERDFGVELFERRSGGYVLTPLGLHTVDLARTVEQAALAFEAETLSWKREITGVLRVTTTELLASEVVAPLVADLREREPGIFVSLLTDDRRLDIRAGEADVAIRLGEPSPEPDIVGRRVGTSPWALYCSVGYAGRAGMPCSAEDLSGHQVIAGSGALENAPAMRWAHQLADSAKVVMCCNTVANLLASVEAGTGIGPLPNFVAKRRTSLLRCLPGHETSAPIWLLYRSGQRNAPHLRVFIGALAARFAELKPLFLEAACQAALPVAEAGPAASGKPT